MKEWRALLICTPVKLVKIILKNNYIKPLELVLRENSKRRNICARNLWKLSKNWKVMWYLTQHHSLSTPFQLNEEEPPLQKATAKDMGMLNEEFPSSSQVGGCLPGGVGYQPLIPPQLSVAEAKSWVRAAKKWPTLVELRHYPECGTLRILGPWSPFPGYFYSAFSWRA